MSASDEIILDGKKYISSRRAGEITRYTNDYIGQLCRAGKVEGKLIGRIRFVEESSLLAYKQMLDSGVKEGLPQTHETAPIKDPAQTVSDPYFPLLKKSGLDLKEEEVSEAKKTVDDLWGKISYTNEPAQASTKNSPEKIDAVNPANLPIIRGQFLPALFSKQIVSKIALTLFGVSLVAGAHAFSSDPMLAKAGEEIFFSAKKEIALKEDELTLAIDAIANDARVAFSGTLKYRTSFANENKISSSEDANVKKQALASTPLALSGNMPAAVSFADEISGIVRTVVDITSRSIYRTLSPFFEQTKRAIVRSLERTPEPTVVTEKPSTIPPLAAEQKQEQVIGTLQTELSNLKASLRSIGTNATPSTRIVYEKPITQITQIGLSDRELQIKLEQYNNKLVAMINDVASRGDTQSQNVYRAVSLSNKIDNLSKVTATNLTVSGVTGLTDSDIPNNITASNYLELTGGTISGLLDITGTGTSTISHNLLVSESLAVGGTCINCGTGTSAGSLTATGVITGPYFIATSTSATSTIAGQLVLNSIPTMAHTFAAWAIGVANANANNASLYLNPASAAADTNILGVAVNGSVKFMIDAEGDVFANSITSTGGETLSTTSISTLTVENNSTMGDSTTTDRTYFNSRIGSSLFPAASNGLDLGDGTNWLTWRTGYFGTSVGVGGTATTSGTQFLAAGSYTIDSKGTLSINTSNNQNIVTGSGNVGIGTSTPYSKVTIWGNSSGTALEVTDNASSTLFSVTNAGETTVIGLNATRSTTTSATTTSLSVSGFASTSNLTVSNIFNLNGTFTALGLSTLANLLMTGSTTLQNVTAVNSTTTNATTTSLQVAQTASTTNLMVSGGATTTAFYSGGLSQLTKLIATDATTTSLQIGTLASTSQMIVSNSLTGHGTLTVSGLSTLANLLMTGSTTLQNFTAVNSTTTNATTTSFAVSSLTSGRVPYLTTGGAFVDSSLFTFDGTRLTATYASTTALSSSGSAYFATTGGNVGIASTTPWGLLSINPNALGAGVPSFVIGSSTATSFIVDNGGMVGIGTTTPGSLFSISGVANFTTATSSFYGNGINLTGGCFAVNGVCAGSGSGTIESGTTGQFPYYAANGTTLTATSSIFLGTSGNVGIGTMSPYNKFQVTGTGTGLGQTFAVVNSASTTLMQIFDNNQVVIGHSGNSNSTSTPLNGNGNDTAAILTLRNGDQTNLVFGQAVSVGGSFHISAVNDSRVSGVAGTVIPLGITSSNFSVSESGGNVSIGSGAITTYKLNIKGTDDGDTIGIYFANSSAAGKFYVRNNGKVSMPGLVSGVAIADDVCYDSDSSELRINTTNDCNSSSSFRYKENINSLSYGLAEVMLLNPVFFNYNSTYAPDSADQNRKIGFIAEEMENIIPEVVQYDTEGLPSAIDYGNLTSLLVKGIQELNLRTGFINNSYGTSTVVYIDSSGNIGIGTSTPAYKLHVMGDVAAQSFVNISTRNSKTDIKYLTEEDDSAILDKLSQTNVATYYYNNDLSSTGGLPTASTTRRFGLIAEEAPSEVLSADGKGVDIYKLGSFLFAGMKAEQKEIARLSSRLDSVESMLAASGGGQTDSVFAWIVDKFNMLGITFTQGVVRATNFIADNLTTKKVVTDDIQANKVITDFFEIRDRQTGSIYCIQIIAGALSSTIGACASDANLEASLPSDTTPPTITINGNNPSTLTIGTTYADLGVVVTDNVDQNLGYQTYVNGVLEQTISLDTSANKTYEITYTATDNAGNTATTTRTVIVGTGTPVLDSTPPVITLSGLSIVTLSQNATYTDSGATATDDTDGDITATIIINNTVNTSATSTYTITYDVTDAAGNQAAQVTRTVIVE